MLHARDIAKDVVLLRKSQMSKLSHNTRSIPQSPVIEKNKKLENIETTFLTHICLNKLLYNKYL